MATNTDGTSADQPDPPVATFINVPSTSDSEYTVLILDAVTTESIRLESEVSRYPVEEGSEISDNIVNRSKELSLSGVVTDMAVSDSAASVGKKKLTDAIQVLESIRAKRKLVTITSGLMIYQDMGLVNCQIERTARESGQIEVQLQFRRIRKVQLKTATVNVAASVKGKSGATKTKASNAAAEPAPNKEQLTSIASAVLGNLPTEEQLKKIAAALAKAAGTGN